MDRRAIAAAEIHAAVHTLVTKDRVAAHPEVRGDASARRPRHAAALFANARRFEPLGAAVGIPFEHRKLGLSAADQPRVEQLARLALARFGAAIVDDAVELVAAANIAADRNLAADAAPIGLDRLRRRAGGARRAVEAVADPPANAPRGRSDRARDAPHHGNAKRG